jgi:Rho termination factor, N-terminal domain
MAKKDPGRGVKDKTLYERLRGAGMSKKKSARVANTAAGTSRPAVGKRGGAAGSYDGWKVTELRRRAKQVGIKGRAAMTKADLIKALRAS